jgi:hypothetical protein
MVMIELETAQALIKIISIGLWFGVITIIMTIIRSALR